MSDLDLWLTWRAVKKKSSLPVMTVRQEERRERKGKPREGPDSLLDIFASSLVQPRQLPVWWLHSAPALDEGLEESSQHPMQETWKKLEFVSVKQNIITHYFTSLFQNNSKKTLNLKQNFPVWSCRKVSAWNRNMQWDVRLVQKLPYLCFSYFSVWAYDFFRRMLFNVSYFWNITDSLF